MKRFLQRLLLGLLNSEWLNGTPCCFEFCNNIDAFTLESLRAEEKQRPGITVAQVIREAELFMACDIGKGDSHSALMVIENGQVREVTPWDYHELRNLK